MSKTLVLAEKPSVGRELARVLGCTKSGEGCLEGAEYIVTWALGHLVELSAPEEYDKAWQKWDLLTLPMLPEPMKTAVIPQSARQFRAVRALLHRGDVKELVIATDAGREGELVARWILEKAGWKGPTKRLWISSQTDRAIREGFARLRPAAEYDNLFYSARARSEADWLVGLNVTRALTCKYNAQLSAGRVQTPTLALIVDREEAIRAFRPREFDTLQIRLEGFTATWRDGQGQARIFDREKARALAGRLAGKEAVIRSLQRKRREAPPPAAYDLTELQRDANRKYAYSAKETLSMMQSLYENHKVLTYPRTDSRYISQDVVPTLPERITSVAVDEYRDLALSIRRQRPLQTKYLVNDAKVSDHHAIIPTEEQVELWRMSGGERNIYDLVVRRFLAVLLPPCVYEEVRLTLEVDGETFTARGKVMVEPGWRAAYDRSFSDLDQEEDEDEREQALPVLREGGALPGGRGAPAPRTDGAPGPVHRGHPPHRYGAPGKPGGGPGGEPYPGGDGRSGHPSYPGGHHREALLLLLRGAAGEGDRPHLQGRPGGEAGSRRPAFGGPDGPVGGPPGGHRPGQGAGGPLCGGDAAVRQPPGERGQGQRRLLHPRQPDPDPLPRLREVPAAGQDQAGGDAGVPRPGVRLPPEREADHQCPLSQLPQADGAAGRGGEADVRLCVRLPGKALRLQKAPGKGGGR